MNARWSIVSRQVVHAERFGLRLRLGPVPAVTAICKQGTCQPSEFLGRARREP